MWHWQEGPQCHLQRRIQQPQAGSEPRPRSHIQLVNSRAGTRTHRTSLPTTLPPSFWLQNVLTRHMSVVFITSFKENWRSRSGLPEEVTRGSSGVSPCRSPLPEAVHISGSPLQLLPGQERMWKRWLPEDFPARKP